MTPSPTWRIRNLLARRSNSKEGGCQVPNLNALTFGYVPETLEQVFHNLKLQRCAVLAGDEIAETFDEQRASGLDESLGTEL